MALDPTTQSAPYTEAPCLYMAIELSASRWRLAHSAGGSRIRESSVVAGDRDRLAVEIAAARKRFGLPEDAKVISHEIFGPVVIVQPVESLEEAIEKVNRSENPFQSSIFTRDVDRAFHAACEVRAAAYMINDLTAFRVDWMPFGGRENAGLLLGGVEHGIHDMTEEKLIVVNAR